MKGKNIIYETSWDYKFLKEKIGFWSQVDWNQTLLTMFNQCSANARKHNTHIDTIEVNPVLVGDIIGSLEYYDKQLKKIGSRYSVIENKSQNVNDIILYNSEHKDSVCVINVLNLPQ